MQDYLSARSSNSHEINVSQQRFFIIPWHHKSRTGDSVALKLRSLRYQMWQDLLVLVICDFLVSLSRLCNWSCGTSYHNTRNPNIIAAYRTSIIKDARSATVSCTMKLCSSSLYLFTAYLFLAFSSNVQPFFIPGINLPCEIFATFSIVSFLRTVQSLHRFNPPT